MTSPAMDVPKAQTDLGSDSVSAHDYAGILVPGLPLVVIDTVHRYLRKRCRCHRDAYTADYVPNDIGRARRTAGDKHDQKTAACDNAAQHGCSRVAELLVQRHQEQYRDQSGKRRYGRGNRHNVRIAQIVCAEVDHHAAADGGKQHLDHLYQNNTQSRHD